MPNGRSGGFPIEVAELKRLVDGTGGAQIGMLAGDNARATGLQPALSPAVLRLLAECRSERVAVEEQDHSAYIIHLSNVPTLWVLVYQDSPIFAGLKQRHDQWKIDNPNSSGWIGF
jgi:hypothetical protein